MYSSLGCLGLFGLWVSDWFGRGALVVWMGLVCALLFGYWYCALVVYLLVAV